MATLSQFTPKIRTKVQPHLEDAKSRINEAVEEINRSEREIIRLQKVRRKTLYVWLAAHDKAMYASQHLSETSKMRHLDWEMHLFGEFQQADAQVSSITLRTGPHCQFELCFA